MTILCSPTAQHDSLFLPVYLLRSHMAAWTFVRPTQRSSTGLAIAATKLPTYLLVQLGKSFSLSFKLSPSSSPIMASSIMHAGRMQDERMKQTLQTT